MINANANAKWMQKQFLDKASKNCFIIGRLFNNDPIRESNEYVRIFIDPLSQKPLPEYNIEADLSNDYLCIDRFQNIVVPDNYDRYSNNIDERIEQWYDLLEGKLIIFYPVYNEKSSGRIFKNANIIQLVPDKDDYSSFDLIPQINMDPQKFDEILMSKDYFDIQWYDSDIYESPEIIKCGNYFYRLKENNDYNGMLEKNTDDPTRWRAVDPSNIVKVDKSSLTNIDKYLIKINDEESLIFIEDTLRNKIEINKNILELGEKAQNEDSEELAEQEYVPSDIEKSESLKQKSEFDFINGLKELTIEKKLLYSKEDLINFHTSIKTNPLTILAGMSGTGKSKLADNYARMLDLSEDNNTLLFMPISPSYAEPGDVLGFYNSLENIYVPAETGLVDFLLHANKVKNKMHMVIFDEMNLSQVEYWFSPFISVLEKEPNERYLKLYDEKLFNDEDKPVKNKDIYPWRIKIENNVIFVGTVNIDETTKDFSDRLLDRTFMVTLQKETFRQFYDDMSKVNNKVDISSKKCSDATEFLSWSKKDTVDYVKMFENHEREIEFLDEFDKILKQYLPKVGVSFRVFKNIGSYLINLPINPETKMPLIERSRAFDIVVNQTIIQKIRGTESQLSELIGDNNAKLFEVLNKYNDVSEFDIVRESLSKKAEDLRKNGYTN